MAKTDVWMPLYVADYLADTLHLSCVEHGAYLLLIMHYWRNGELPNDDAKLARITKCTAREWAKIRPTIGEFFTEDWRHRRVESELERAGGKVKTRSTAGIAGAESRWGSPARNEAKKKRSERLTAARALGKHTPAEWQALLQVFSNKCVQCGCDASELEGGGLCKDHVTAIYQGGSDAIDNIQPMCRNCNSTKGAETIDYRENVRQNWKEALAKRLANAWQTPGPSPSPSPSERNTQYSTTTETNQDTARGGSESPGGDGKVSNADLVRNAAPDIKAQAHALRERLEAKLNLGTPVTAAPIIDWLQKGATAELIEATIDDVLATKPTFSGFAYFGPAVKRAIEQGRRPGKSADFDPAQFIKSKGNAA